MTTATIHDGASICKQVSRAPRRWLLFFGAIAAILVASSPRLASAPLDQVAATPVLSSPSSSASLAHTDAGCWVSGDLVGDANPATIAAAFCGR